MRAEQLHLTDRGHTSVLFHQSSFNSCLQYLKKGNEKKKSTGLLRFPSILGEDFSKEDPASGVLIAYTDCSCWMLIVGQREEVAAFSRCWDHHWTTGVVSESVQR